MAKQQGEQRPGKHRPRHDADNPKDVRKAVEEQDRDRARRIQDWENTYTKLLKEQRDDKNGHRSQDGKTPITPFLLIRYTNLDLGARPIPPGTPFWASPDIWIESSDPFGNPVAGEQNFIHARLFNLGAFQAAPVQVDFFWANPALGLGPASMNHVGKEWVQVPSLGSADVRCSSPWIPVLVNNGHECVMVNCSCALSDPILHPFQPTLDRHVGQRNLNVVPGKAGQKLIYTLQVINIFPVEMPALITAQFEHLTRTDEAREIPLHELGGLAATFTKRNTTSPFHLTDMYVRESREHKLAQRSAALHHRSTTPESTPFKRLDGNGMALTVDVRGTRGAIQTTGMGRQASELFAALDMFREPPVNTAPGFVVQKLHLEASSFQTIDVQVDVPADAGPGDVFVTHLQHHVGPMTVGGYAMVVIIE